MADLKQFVGFMISHEHYGIDIMAVEEIIRMVEITPVPRAPVFVEGIINMRGRVIPIVDLRKKLNIMVSDESDSTRIVVVNINNRRIGLIVDKVEEVIRIEDGAIEDAPGTAHTDNNYISGVARTSKCMVIILDINRLFSSQEVMALDNFS